MLSKLVDACDSGFQLKLVDNNTVKYDTNTN